MDHLTIEETAEFAEYEAYQDSRDEEGLGWISFETYRAMFPVIAAEVVAADESDDIPF